MYLLLFKPTECLFTAHSLFSDSFAPKSHGGVWTGEGQSWWGEGEISEREPSASSDDWLLNGWAAG